MSAKNEPRLPVTAAIIAHNEAHNIRRCIDSVVKWVSEVVVVVNDCTDGTDQIAESYGAKVYHESWHGHRDQKNIALGYATFPWVFSIDADEAVSDALRASIETFIVSNNPVYAGAYFPRKVWFLGRWILHGDWYPDYSLRLFKKECAHWGGCDEHDKLELKGRAKRLQGDLFHYSNPSLNGQIQKINYFSDLFLRRQLAAGRKFSLWNAILRPPWRFFRAYILRAGFLDGFPGFYIACLNAFSALVRHSRLYEYNHDPIIHEKFSSYAPHKDLQ